MGESHIALTFREGRAVMARSLGRASRCARERPPHNLKDRLDGVVPPADTSTAGTFAVRRVCATGVGRPDCKDMMLNGPAILERARLARAVLVYWTPSTWRPNSRALDKELRF